MSRNPAQGEGCVVPLWGIIAAIWIVAMILAAPHIGRLLAVRAAVLRDRSFGEGGE